MQNIISVIMTLSLLFGAMAVRASARQRLRQLEMLYVQRYWALMDKLSLSALRGAPSTVVDADDEKVVRVSGDGTATPPLAFQCGVGADSRRQH